MFVETRRGTDRLANVARARGARAARHIGSKTRLTGDSIARTGRRDVTSDAVGTPAKLANARSLLLPGLVGRRLGNGRPRQETVAPLLRARNLRSLGAGMRKPGRTWHAYPAAAHGSRAGARLCG